MKTPHGFPSFYSVSFRCRLLEGFSFAGKKVLVRNSKGLCGGRFGLGKVTQQKKLQRRKVDLLFCCIEAIRV